MHKALLLGGEVVILLDSGYHDNFECYITMYEVE